MTICAAVLVIEDEQIFAKNICTYLQRRNFEVMTAGSGEEGLERLPGFAPDVVLLDWHLPGMNGLEVLAEIRRQAAQVRVIMLTAHGSVEVAVQAMKGGADDYLSKPVALNEIEIAIEKVLKLKRAEQKIAFHVAKEAQDGAFSKLIGESPAMLKLKDAMQRLLAAEKVLPGDDLPSVLITGETGTGKELVARALHFEGTRKAQPFIEVNCASIPAPLLESELFGFEKGAFTDARQRKPGLIEAADGGTLFLDEVGELDMAAQVKLLKVIEDRRVRRLGAVRDRPVNFRIIAATNQEMERRVQDGTFRADLFFRLRTVHLRLPPLRDRGPDILALAKLFLHTHGARYQKRGLKLSHAAELSMLEWRWPGNVREMRNMLEQAVLFATGTVISPEQLMFPSTLLPAHSGIRDTLRDPRATADLNVGKMERDFLIQALKQANWNVTQASRLLGLSRDTLRYRMEKHGIRNDVNSRIGTPPVGRTGA